jgi:indole-3-glycerol phosphate synthase
MRTFLDEILVDVRAELDAARAKRPPAQIRRMIPDAPAIRPLHGSLSGPFRLIAEIKERSPSVGPMRRENVAEAARSYEESPIVAAVSVLTNSVHFGMSIERLREIRKAGSKPVLRKDFIVEEYQIREARAFGSDSILLMANVLDRSRLRGFYDLARELGMEALFEVHTKEEISRLPADARIIGINSRKFRATTGFVGGQGASETDFSLDYAAFDLAESLPAGTLRVAESGLTPERVTQVREHFDAALVGTSLLRDPRGVPACLEGFEQALG